MRNEGAPYHPTDSETTSTRSNENKEVLAPTPFRYEIITNPEQRELLAERVDNLIESVIVQEVDNLIFLEKTARPIVTLFSDLWHRKHQLMDPPPISFMNIGSETDDEAIPDAEIERLRSSYRYLAEAPENSTVMIVDEWSQSGHTFEKAVAIMERAFPNLKVITAALANVDENQGGSVHDKVFELFGSPPWRKAITEVGYGMTGVVDQIEDEPMGSLTARASAKLSPEEQYRALDNESEEHEESKLDNLSEFTQVLNNLPTELIEFNQTMDEILHDTTEQIDHQSVKSAVVRFAQNYTENTLQPKLETARNAAAQILPLFQEGQMDGFATLGLSNSEIVRYKEAMEQLQIIPPNIVYREKKQYILQNFVDPFLSQFDDGPVTNNIRVWLVEYLDNLHIVMSNFLFDNLSPLTSAISDERDVAGNNQRKHDIENNSIRPQIIQLRKEMHEIAKDYWEKYAHDS